MVTGASRTMHALGSHQKARISFELHGCVTWMSMSLTALEALDRSWQPARSVELDDLRLQVDRVERRSLAGCRLHNLGSGQQAAAGPRWRGGSARIASANGLSCSERATMWAGRAPCERRCIPDPNKTVPNPVRASSLDHAMRPGGAPHSHPPSWLSPVHSPGCSWPLPRPQ